MTRESSHFQPFLAMLSHFQSFPATPAFSRHFRNFQSFQPFPAISAISSHFQPIQPFPAIPSHSQSFLGNSSHFHLPSYFIIPSPCILCIMHTICIFSVPRERWDDLSIFKGQGNISVSPALQQSSTDKYPNIDRVYSDFH